MWMIIIVMNHDILLDPLLPWRGDWEKNFMFIRSFALHYPENMAAESESHCNRWLVPSKRDHWHRTGIREKIENKIKYPP